MPDRATLHSVISDGHYFSPVDGREFTTREFTVPLAGAERTVVSARGIFSHDGLDKATAVLLNNTSRLLPIPAGARLLDLGCGWGPIALTLAIENPDSLVTAVDINEHARRSTDMNAKRLGLSNVRVVAPDELSESERFDYIWSNPPIRIGKEALHALLLTWLERLEDDGAAALVVGKNLGADSLATWLSAQFPERTVVKAHSAKGFRLIEVGPTAA